jgi:hypothetical protein
MKTRLGITAAAMIAIFAAVSGAKAQTALFIYNDNSGVPNAGTYTPGSSFTFDISLAFTPGGTIQNLAGLSYWFQQLNPSIAPFPFSITLRNVTGSQFTFLQTPGLTYPQNLNPSNPNDLGATTQSGTGLGAGTYFVASITVNIPLNAPTSGTFTLSNTLTGGKTHLCDSGSRLRHHDDSGAGDLANASARRDRIGGRAAPQAAEARPRGLTNCGGAARFFSAFGRGVFSTRYG